MRVYLDHNATMPLRPQARAAMLAAMDVVGNPSSVHAEGRAARAIVEAARDKVAAALGCAPTEVVFTSGATEAASVLAQLPGGVEVEPTAHDALWQQRRAGEAGFYAMGLANGETGVILPLPQRDDLLVDVTQAVGRYKAAHDLPPADPGREDRQIARLRTLAEDAKLDPDFTEKFLRFIIDEVIRHHEGMQG